ncbi:MAG: alpha/beta fold hydrolase [Streptosporangiales bacterium]|nr:alpha/beta fold hydrolase [Streptosporangiales bacterium]
MHGNRRGLTAAVVTLLAGLSLASPVRLAAADSSATCREHRVPVSALPGVGGTYHIAGTLCTPASGSPGTIQLLIPGAAYNRTYWDFPVPGYSYARAAAARGQATFAIDRFNTGASSHLPPALVTVDLDAAAVHKVISALRDGQVGGVPFSRVVTVGHSLGSGIAVQEAATYHDVDGVILTGFTDYISAETLVGLSTLQLLAPAPNEPVGELTTPPGERERWFYVKENADPAVIAKDEATKDTSTASEIATVSVPGLTLPTHLITAPVFLAIGGKDINWVCVARPCGDAATLRRTEAPRFTAASSLEAYALPGAGHNINLHRNRNEFFDAAAGWVDRRVG